MVPVPRKPSYSAVASPYKVFQGITRQYLSGRLLISEDIGNSVVWQLHIGDGQLHYASSLEGQRELLTYLLSRLNSPYPHWMEDWRHEDAYGTLCRAWRRNELSLSQLRNLLRLISQEALIQVLSKSAVELQFKRTIGLDPIVWSSSLTDLAAPFFDQAQRWKRLSPHISSPFQRIHLNNSNEFENRFTQLMPWFAEESLSSRLVLDGLEQCPCFYELAAYLNLRVLSIARILKPLITAGVITLRPFAEDQLNRPTIMCIDDSRTVQRKVKLLLESEGYRVIGLTDPLTALSSLVREKPSLLFLDITMPNLDGYDLCRMLRRSPTLQDIPIVMLTGRDGLIDRVRAKMVGASGYITKPFNTQSLIDVIHKFIQKG